LLIGVSLGPGDPELLTLKSIAALKSSHKVFVPGEMAAQLARPYCQPEVLEFPMIEDETALERVWEHNADIVAQAASAGQTAFACMGDANTFSTFTHLKRLVEERHPKVVVESIPGVGAVQALAARLGAGLDRSFQVSDGSPLDAVIRLKATKPAQIAEELAAQGFIEFALGVRLCTEEEQVVRGKMPEQSGYFSVLLARRAR